MCIWRMLLCVSLIVIVILLVVLRKTTRYINVVNRNGVIIDTTLLDNLHAPVREMILVHRPVSELSFIDNYYASHVAVICITDIGNLLVSVGEFGDTYVRRAHNTGMTWTVIGYGGPLKEIARYRVDGSVILIDVLSKFIAFRSCPFRLLTYNCHHITCGIIKHFCIYDEHDECLACSSGINLIKRILYNQ